MDGWGDKPDEADEAEMWRDLTPPAAAAAAAAGGMGDRRDGRDMREREGGGRLDSVTELGLGSLHGGVATYPEPAVGMFGGAFGWPWPGWERFRWSSRDFRDDSRRRVGAEDEGRSGREGLHPQVTTAWNGSASDDDTIQ